MALKLMYITNNPEIARIAEASGADWIFVDLEIIGKNERQGHLDTVISHHTIDDIRPIKSVLNTSQLLVRSNPIYESSAKEIEQIIENGADIIMLPFFKTAAEVQTFIKLINGKAATCLLCETPEAVENIDAILKIPGIDYIHIGLNDLHLGYGMKFMFEPLANGTVEKLAKKIKQKNISFGFGGIAQLGQGTLPAEIILAEHHRLGSEMVILSRTFCNTSHITDPAKVLSTFRKGIADIRAFEGLLNEKTDDYFTENKIMVINKVNQIVNANLLS